MDAVNESTSVLAHLSLHLSKCHIVENHMSRLINVFFSSPCILQYLLWKACADPEEGHGIRTGPPWKITKSIGFLSSPLKKSQSFKDGIQCWAIIDPPAMMARFSGIFDLLPLIKTVVRVELNPLLQIFLDPGMEGDEYYNCFEQLMICMHTCFILYLTVFI